MEWVKELVYILILLLPFAGYIVGRIEERNKMKAQIIRGDIEEMLPRITCSKCAERSQKWLGEASMKLIGWREMGDGWWCPFCTGNLKDLHEAFEKQARELGSA